MAGRFKPVSRDDAYPGEAQPMGRINFTQRREKAPDAREKTHIQMKKHLLTDINRFS
jgi:hypothetical protein